MRILATHTAAAAAADIGRSGVGLVLMAVGTGAIGYAAYLEMIHGAALRWWDRAILLAPAGLVALIAGALLAR